MLLIKKINTVRIIVGAYRIVKINPMLFQVDDILVFVPDESDHIFRPLKYTPNGG
jgi:hypothetical protein